MISSSEISTPVINTVLSGMSVNRMSVINTSGISMSMSRMSVISMSSSSMSGG